MRSSIVHAVRAKETDKTTCGLMTQYRHGLNVTRNEENVNCQKCLVNIEHEKQKEISKINAKLMGLLRLIKIYNEVGCLEEEFKAFAGYDEPIKTIDELIEVMEDEMSYWEAE